MGETKEEALTAWVLTPHGVAFPFGEAETIHIDSAPGKGIYVAINTTDATYVVAEQLQCQCQAEQLIRAIVNATEDLVVIRDLLGKPISHNQMCPLAPRKRNRPPDGFLKFPKSKRRQSVVGPIDLN